MNMTITTTSVREIVDLTDRLFEVVRTFSTGIVVLNAPHTTVALFVTELDNELSSDYLRVTERLLENGRPYAHFRNNNPNTEAHILSAMFGTSVTLSVSDGMLQLGRYQRVVLFELDGPKTRTVFLTHVGSA